MALLMNCSMVPIVVSEMEWVRAASQYDSCLHSPIDDAKAGCESRSVTIGSDRRRSAVVVVDGMADSIRSIHSRQ